MSQKSSTATVVKEQIQDAGLGMDLITFEVMRNAFVAACYEASTTIERIAIGIGDGAIFGNVNFLLGTTDINFTGVRCA